MNMIKVLKDEFRQWYGILSVEEIITNQPLISSIEQIEKLITRVCCLLRRLNADCRREVIGKRLSTEQRSQQTLVRKPDHNELAHFYRQHAFPEPDLR